MSHLYVHIPFCKSRCGYCDFVTSTELDLIDDYVDLLCREIKLLYDRYPFRLKTLYFGGGTPSLLSPSAFKRICTAIGQTFGAVQGEFTVEVNPESVDEDWLKGVIDLGVNRISLGMQAYREQLLKVLDRNSRYRDVYQLVERLQRNGIVNYNIDCIYGIPGQTVDDVAETIARICDLTPTHVSAYALKLEATVPLAKRIARGDLALPSDDEFADMLDVIIDQLALAGIARYEVSNFARPNYHSRHNAAYWSAVDTLAVGLAAAYKIANRRYYNVTPFIDYRRLLAAGQLPRDDARSELLTANDLEYEYAILNLRTTKGIDLADYRTKFGRDFSALYRSWIDKYRRYGVLVCTDGRLFLNDRGLNTANYILSDL